MKSQSQLKYVCAGVGVAADANSVAHSACAARPSAASAPHRPHLLPPHRPPRLPARRGRGHSTQ
jgi:hypothetical protein